ncbi:hypothetical protein OGAPHI_001347 [Ogataea philodendri]|uniref:Uncharacterized protein n=1 Tax=Ogataea philodendri TaxID=1378263 RepID=A0A9P8T7V7_9ASCO|nr:uncharacterized protein OGAPHI_001347 [Ogataea philodendri]KAH3669226.1 hypothetical protein OGAPHI_001347 [Ogataea philodendri]
MYKIAPRVPPMESLITFSRVFKVKINEPLEVNFVFSKVSKMASTPILRPSPQSPSPILVSQMVSSGSFSMMFWTAVLIIVFNVSGLTLTSPCFSTFRADESSS